MFSHIMLGTNDIDAAKTFYDATLGALGIAAGMVDGAGRLVYAHGGGRLLLTRPIDGGAASHGNGATTGFYASSTEAVDAWHEAGQAHGGTVCENPPGVRTLPDGRRLYIAYLRDPSGNKLCALHPVK